MLIGTSYDNLLKQTFIIDMKCSNGLSENRKQIVYGCQMSTQLFKFQENCIFAYRRIPYFFYCKPVKIIVLEAPLVSMARNFNLD